MNQKTEPEARDQLLKDIFFNNNPNVLPQILSDVTNGIPLVRKIYSGLSSEEQAKIAEQISAASLSNPELLSCQGYKRLQEDLGHSTVSVSPKITTEYKREEEIVSPLTPRAGGHFHSPVLSTPFSASPLQPFPTPSQSPQHPGNR